MLGQAQAELERDFDDLRQISFRARGHMFVETAGPKVACFAEIYLQYLNLWFPEFPEHWIWTHTHHCIDLILCAYNTLQCWHAIPQRTPSNFRTKAERKCRCGPLVCHPRYWRAHSSVQTACWISTLQWQMSISGNWGHITVVDQLGVPHNCKKVPPLNPTNRRFQLRNSSSSHGRRLPPVDDPLPSLFVFLAREYFLTWGRKLLKVIFLLF